MVMYWSLFSKDNVATHKVRNMFRSLEVSFCLSKRYALLLLETNRMKEKAVIVVCHKLEWLSFSYHINQPQGIRACFSAGIIFTITLRGQSSHFTDEENEVQKVKCLSTISNLAMSKQGF